MLPSEWHALIAGDGDARASVLALAASLGVKDRLHLPGWVEDAREVYAALDATAFLAPYQSFCLMIAESMASGVPVVGLRGFGEYFEPENPLVTEGNSLLYPRCAGRFDIEPMSSLARVAEALKGFGRDTNPYSRRADVARQHVRDHFSGHVQAVKMAEVYRQVLAAPRR